MDRAVVDNEKTFARGSGAWRGVVAIERPKNASKTTPCAIKSARSILYDGKRAVVFSLPYGAVAKFFRAGDGDTVYHYGEFKDGTFLFYERTSHKDFFLNAGDGS